MNPSDTLPMEAVRMICTLLRNNKYGAADLAAVRLVCKQWSQIANGVIVDMTGGSTRLKILFAGAMNSGARVDWLLSHLPICREIQADYGWMNLYKIGARFGTIPAMDALAAARVPMPRQLDLISHANAPDMVAWIEERVPHQGAGDHCEWIRRLEPSEYSGPDGLALRCLAANRESPGWTWINAYCALLRHMEPGEDFNSWNRWTCLSLGRDRLAESLYWLSDDATVNQRE